MRRLPTALALLTVALAATPALSQAATTGSNLDKVLVIGTDGTRWDLVKAAIRSGRAPNLARLSRQGFARPAPLDYGPNVLTLSEVGWSSIASGVWPGKHGVDGRKFNMDPGQATKNGYLDFITRIETAAPSLDTYLASDWVNIGTTENGGPIFGSAMDARFNVAIAEEKLELWNAGDVKVTQAASRRLRSAGADASFVYLGLVDETAHLVGSATPAYADAIATTDRRIGQLIRAVRSRPSYPFESWTILVTTDHGQRALDEPSIASHLSSDAARDHLLRGGLRPGSRPQRQEAARGGHRPHGSPAARSSRPAGLEARRPAAGELARALLGRRRAARKGRHPPARGLAAADQRARRSQVGRAAFAARRQAEQRSGEGVGERPAGIGAVLRAPNRRDPGYVAGSAEAVLRDRARGDRPRRPRQEGRARDLRPARAQGEPGHSSPQAHRLTRLIEPFPGSVRMSPETSSIPEVPFRCASS